MPKTIAITGANTGMGKAASLQLARKGCRILMLTRNLSRGEQAAEEVRKATGNTEVEAVSCDLGSLSSIAACAQQIKAISPQLDVLINNAGVITLKREETEDGFERQLGVNHLGHFALTLQLMEPLAAAMLPKVINVASGAHKAGRIHWNDPFLQQGYNVWKAYAQSKWANVLFTIELAERMKELNGVAFSLHPGAVSTDIGVNRQTGFGRTVHRLLRPFFLTPEQGAATAIYLADSDQELDHSGGYFYKQKPARISSKGVDSIQEARRLWEWSEQQTGVKWPF